MKRFLKEWSWVLYIVALIALFAFGGWAWFAGPCWLYQFNKLGEIPARCLLEVTR